MKNYLSLKYGLLLDYLLKYRTNYWIDTGVLKHRGYYVRILYQILFLIEYLDISSSNRERYT